MNIRTKRVACAIGATGLLLAACGQKETAPPPTEARPIVATPGPADATAPTEASAHADATPHDVGSEATTSSQNAPPMKGQPEQHSMSDMSGMKMPK